MQVSAGFSSRYRDGDWIPLRVTLHNNGPDFTGAISVNSPNPYAAGNGTPASSSRYQQTITLSNGAQKQIMMYVPISFGAQGSTQTLAVDLLDSNGNKVTSQSSTLRSLGPNDLLVGVLSDQSSSISTLGQVTQPNQTASVYEEPLDATSLPANAEVLQNFDLIVMDNFTTSTLSKEQLAALDNWVSQGGNLVIAGGPEWRRTLTALPSGLTPVNVTGSSTMPAGTDLLPIGGPDRSGPGQNVSGRAPAAFVVSNATPNAGSTVLLARNQVPLMVEAQHNQGNIYYLAFDPSLNPLANWSNAANIWKGLLIRTVGDRFLDASQNPGVYSFLHASNSLDGGWEAVLQSLFPNAFPATWLILALLIGYIVILGPVRFIVVRLVKKRTWSWRIVLATIVVFSLLSYGLAIQQKGTSIIGSSISIIQLGETNANSSGAHVTTYTGVFVPNQGDFVVHFPNNNLIQPLSEANISQGSAVSSYSSLHTTIATTANGTDVNLQGVDIWTLQSLVTNYDTQVKGGISSHLLLQNGTLGGTITNNLPYGLNDAYVLVANQFINLGHLDAGQTRQISTAISASASSSNISLADQIAASHGLPVPYTSNTTGGTHEENEYQRHAAVLSTMSGENSGFTCVNGGICYQQAAPSGLTKQIAINGRGTSSSNEQDPLLLPNTAATLIGWVGNNATPANNIMINGTNAQGVQESLLQAPLDVTYDGGINVPADFVTSRLTDVQSQGSNIQTQFPGVYTLSTGSMTFEFALPAMQHLRTDMLTFTENTNIVNGIGNIGNGNGNINMPGDLSHIHTYLYNWQTHQWDNVSFNQNTLTLQNAQVYANEDGRIFMQFSNQDSTQGTTLLTRPTLQLQGQVSR